MPPAKAYDIGSELEDVPTYVRQAAEIYQYTLNRIAISIYRLGKAEAEVSVHRKSLEQWRKTLTRPRP
jgi:hypothetical protein